MARVFIRESGVTEMEITTGALVKSLAGHDKNSFFFILKEEGEYVYLVDGKIRTLDRPKKKKRKHVEAVLWEENSPGTKLKRSETITDEEIKRFIRWFCKENRASGGD